MLYVFLVVQIRLVASVSVVVVVALQSSELPCRPVFNKKIKLGYIAKTITPCKGKNSHSVTSWLQSVG